MSLFQEFEAMDSESKNLKFIKLVHRYYSIVKIRIFLLKDNLF